VSLCSSAAQLDSRQPVVYINIAVEVSSTQLACHPAEAWVVFYYLVALRATKHTWRISLYEPVDQEMEAELPTPCGYRLLVAMPAMQEKTAGGVYMPDKLKDAEKVASVVAQVIDMGEEAYDHPEKFPSGPWCAVGDWVIFRSYSGTRIDIKGREYRLINDDTVEAVVNDPATVKRAF